MDKIQKALLRMSEQERIQVEHVLARITAGDFANLDIVKLKGRMDFFRVRKGKIRVIFQKKNGKNELLTVERRSDTTYNS